MDIPFPKGWLRNVIFPSIVKTEIQDVIANLVPLPGILAEFACVRSSNLFFFFFHLFCKKLQLTLRQNERNEKQKGFKQIDKILDKKLDK